MLVISFGFAQGYKERMPGLVGGFRGRYAERTPILLSVISSAAQPARGEISIAQIRPAAGRGCAADSFALAKLIWEWRASGYRGLSDSARRFRPLIEHTKGS